jgi:hypothetical protein
VPESCAIFDTTEGMHVVGKICPGDVVECPATAVNMIMKVIVNEVLTSG